MNRMPSRWSVSCCTQRASSSVPSIVTGSPCMFWPLATTLHARLVGNASPGKDRQPSSSVLLLVAEGEDGVDQVPGSSSTQ